MQFETNSIGYAAASSARPLVMLASEKWDDKGHSTTFIARLLHADGRKARLGKLKILKRGFSITQLPAQFKRLSSDCCSIGQNLDFYRSITKLPMELGMEILKSLRDIVLTPLIAEPFKLDPGFFGSLLRLAETRDARRDAAIMLRQWDHRASPDPRDSRMQFEFKTSFPWMNGPIEIDFLFDRNRLGRIVTLIGPNGSGKTQFLGALASALSGFGTRRRSRLTPRLKRRVIALSYSAFDRFTRPRASSKSYRYWGLLDSASRLSLQQLEENVLYALRDIVRRGEKAVLLNALQQATLTDIEPLVARIVESPAKPGRLLAKMSAGSQLAFMAVCGLVRDVERDSVVLFDEPEIHLHPRLLAGLMRCLHGLLDERDAIAVVATHSPIPVQETPARQVRIIDIAEGRVPTVRAYEGESFGASLGEIVRVAFRESTDQPNYLRILRESAVSGELQELEETLSDDRAISVDVALDQLRPKSVGRRQ
jgi:ABC-type branched-subunit amino acid transport system ATPase component